MFYYIEVYKYDKEFRRELFYILKHLVLDMQEKIYVDNVHCVNCICWSLNNHLMISGYDRKTYFERTSNIYSYLDIKKLKNMVSSAKAEDYNEHELLLLLEEYSNDKRKR